jgi:hypothetical protein
VILWDFYAVEGGAFFERDGTCPYICHRHAWENEDKAEGERHPRGRMTYPFTNRGFAQGFNLYVPLK